MVIFCSLPVATSFAVDVDDAVGVDVEGNLDLRHPTRRRRKADQVEAAQRAVVASHLPLALKHVNLDAGLVVRRRREDLALAGRNRRVAVDERRHHAAQRLDAERQRRHVEQQDVLDFPLQHATLNCRAHSHDFVRVDTLVRLLAEEVLHQLLNLRRAGRTANQHDLVDLRRLEAGVGERPLNRTHRTLQQIRPRAARTWRASASSADAWDRSGPP